MPFIVKGKKHHHSVAFKRKATTASSDPSSSSPSRTFSRLLHVDQKARQPGFNIEKSLSSTGEAVQAQVLVKSPSQGPGAMSAKPAECSMISDLFTTLPLIRDLLNTETSQLQDGTILECLPFLSGTKGGIAYNSHGVPHLDRPRHISFLHKSLRKLPARYVAADASRPWMFYWALAGLSAMGEDVSAYRERMIATVRPMQNIAGGFGGGNGQMSHLAPTYAIILSLAIVGGREALDIIDRKAMWKWLGALKQPDGGFQMSIGGEEDVRGAYCVTVFITLLDLPLALPRESPAWSREDSTLLTGLPQWVARCQTFEGGISSRPDAEAHGAYAFCALACLCIQDDPHVIIPKYLDVPRLISWLSARQYGPEGGFAGRTNKLVDGCYSHWVGGCWPLIEACVSGPTSLNSATRVMATTQISPASPVGSLYSREGLIRYILCCCQDQTERGGLRDKPSTKSDSYHTCYVLAGLGSAQHKWHFQSSATKTETSGVLVSAYQWAAEPFHGDPQVYDEEDRVLALHPVFAIPEGAAEETRAYFASKAGF